MSSADNFRKTLERSLTAGETIKIPPAIGGQKASLIARTVNTQRAKEDPPKMVMFTYERHGTTLGTVVPSKENIHQIAMLSSTRANLHKKLFGEALPSTEMIAELVGIRVKRGRTLIQAIVQVRNGLRDADLLTPAFEKTLETFAMNLIKGGKVTNILDHLTA